VSEHFDGFATEDDCRNSATPVRSHHNDVTTPGSRGTNDGLVRMFVLDLDGLACNSRRFCFVGDNTENLRSALLNMLLILVGRVFDNLRVEREDMKWSRNREHCEIEITVQFRGRPDLAGFDASVVWRGMLDKMRLAPIPEIEL
jgi:hypothetical protein